MSSCRRLRSSLRLPPTLLFLFATPTPTILSAGPTVQKQAHDGGRCLIRTPNTEAPRPRRRLSSSASRPFYIRFQVPWTRRRWCSIRRKGYLFLITLLSVTDAFKAPVCQAWQHVILPPRSSATRPPSRSSEEAPLDKFPGIFTRPTSYILRTFPGCVQVPNCSAHAFHSMIATDWPSIASSVRDCRRPRRGVRAVVAHREDQNAIRVGKTKIDEDVFGKTTTYPVVSAFRRRIALLSPCGQRRFNTNLDNMRHPSFLYSDYWMVNPRVAEPMVFEIRNKKSLSRR
ncbi:hypothetical protein FB451DRAFT_1472702 [Mycena latifolia]|nr:hypothetical protein FB451DRAFT_1472702 [Mycena latifolia]